MKPRFLPLPRLLAACLTGLMLLPAVPLQAEGPIEHLQKRRRQIHQKLGELFSGIGRSIERAADRVERGREEPLPPPPPEWGADDYGYRDPSRERYDDDWEWREREIRPGRTYPDGTPYPDAGEPLSRTDRRSFRGYSGREPGVNPYGQGRRFPADERMEDLDPYESRRAPVPPPSAAMRDRETPVPKSSKAQSGEPQAKPTPAATSRPPETEGLRYGRPVPGKQGFVYPPGVKEEAKNMIDVRDFRPGQKVKDPRTGEIFLVP